MGETVQMVRQKASLHLNKYQQSYLRLILYNMIMVLPYLHSEFKGYPNFGDITPMQWFIMSLWTMYLFCSTTASFIDGTYGKEKTSPTQETTNSKVTVI